MSDNYINTARNVSQRRVTLFDRILKTRQDYKNVDATVRIFRDNVELLINDVESAKNENLFTDEEYDAVLAEILDYRVALGIDLD